LVEAKHSGENPGGQGGINTGEKGTLQKRRGKEKGDSFYFPWYVVGRGKSAEAKAERRKAGRNHDLRTLSTEQFKGIQQAKSSKPTGIRTNSL